MIAICSRFPHELPMGDCHKLLSFGVKKYGTDNVHPLQLGNQSEVYVTHVHYKLHQ